jgi:hypothetical protein
VDSASLVVRKQLVASVLIERYEVNTGVSGYRAWVSEDEAGVSSKVGIGSTQAEALAALADRLDS